MSSTDQKTDQKSDPKPGEKPNFSAKAHSILSQLDTTLEKAGLGRALSFLNETASGTRKILANERILAQLKRIGVATCDEVEALKVRVTELEDEVARLKRS